MAKLTDHEVRVLVFAEARANGSKAHTIHEFGWRETTYVIELRKLIARPEVVADPRWAMLAKRQDRMMADAARARASRSFRVSA